MSILALDGSDWVYKDFYGEDWLWRGSHKPGTLDKRQWRANGTVPGSIQHDLWQGGELPNPYYELNSRLIEWVSERSWLYRKTFRIDEVHRGHRARLHFSGVDYAARFFLNGELLGDHHGMFTSAEFEVSDLVKWGEENLVAVVIDAAPEEQPQVGYTSRVRTMKARMNYWWDFCPRMVHLGVWDHTWLEIGGQALIDDVWVRPQLSDDHHHAQVEVMIEESTEEPVEAGIKAVIRLEGQEIAAQMKNQSLPAGKSQVTLHFEIKDPQLWWPNGMGTQPLYELELYLSSPTLHNGGQEGSVSKKVLFGLRRIEFIQNEGAADGALPYTLTVNGRRAYIKGWNWVPIDVLYGPERQQKLERLLRLAQRAQVNLLRVWGGGLIERENFYHLCDSLGLLVWQEFIQSSSGIDNNPPDNPDFINWVEGQAREIVRGRRNHPSLALWCGGNELQSGPNTPQDDRHPMLARLRAVVQELDPGRHWLPTSPSGPEFANDLETIERDPHRLQDVHGPWEHQGVEKHFTLYNAGSSLLHSEFGVEGITNQITLDRTVSKEHQKPVSLDNPIWYHLGAWWVKEAAWKAIWGDYQVLEMEVLVNAMQFLQADGLRYAIEANRRRKWHNSGSLPWQFNEPYPMAACTSAVDYYTHPKPAYYTVAQAYSPLTITARFPRQAWGGHIEFEAEIWASNEKLQGEAGAWLEAALIGMDGQRLFDHMEEIMFEGEAAGKLATVRWLLDQVGEVFFLDLRLLAQNRSLLAQNRYIFSHTHNLEPFLHLANTDVVVYKQDLGDRWDLTVQNIGATTALWVFLEDGRAVEAVGYVYFSNNYFCLFPGEERRVQVEWEGVPTQERSITARGLNVHTSNF